METIAQCHSEQCTQSFFYTMSYTVIYIFVQITKLLSLCCLFNSTQVLMLKSLVCKSLILDEKPLHNYLAYMWGKCVCLDSYVTTYALVMWLPMHYLCKQWTHKTVHVSNWDLEADLSSLTDSVIIINVILDKYDLLSSTDHKKYIYFESARGPNNIVTLWLSFYGPKTTWGWVNEKHHF